ncbi:MAG: hemolysin secretion protein D [Gammaproteobacteria bacterium HGW-Gammaproteobacteria-4]|jgi:hemolysin D|nr:MAG: hemolysin secretion protein D [Gammaproteobacteria bacterium HGW-Gammaproteobacteria-4]
MSITHHLPGSHILLAVRDFLARYRKVFTAAWAVRAQLDPPQRSADELAFLPAHLELTDTPASPTARWLIRIIIAFFCVALLWATLGMLDIVAVAPGKIVVGSRTKIVQPAETGVVTRIWVRDGQLVKRGELLIELDATGTGADHAKADDALIDARLALLRLSALARAMDTGEAPHLEPDPSLPPERVQAEQALASSVAAAFRVRVHNLQATLAQRRAELHTIQSLIQPSEDAARIATARAENVATLLEKHYVGRHDYLVLEQERIAAQRELITQRNRLVEARSAIDGAQEQLRVLIAEMRQQTLDELRQANERVAQLSPDVDKTRQRDRMTQLRAPVDGAVQQLAVHTIGGVVTPAQPLLAIVPSDEALEIEANVLNKDIGFVRPGQAVTVKIESFPYTRYGYLDGVVESVSHDAAQDDTLGLIFPARIRLTQTHLMIDGVRVTMTPGMSVSAEVKTGTRRVIDYLLSPLQQHQSEAMREQ